MTLVSWLLVGAMFCLFVALLALWREVEQMRAAVSDLLGVLYGDPESE